MAAGTIKVEQKANQTLGLHFTDAAGADISITGETAKLYASRGIDQPNLITKTDTSHPQLSQGRTQVALTATELDMNARGYSYEIWPDPIPTDIGTFVVEDTINA